MADLEGVVLVVGAIGVLFWLFWPVINRRRDPPPIPPASIAGRVDFEKLQRGRELQSGEVLRVTLGIVVVVGGLGFLVFLVALVESMSGAYGN